MSETIDNDGPQLLRFDRNLQGRDFVVGDIHGCFTLLQTALDAIGFSPTVDRLFCSGDLVDRGPESHQVVSWLDKPWFFATMGNHDFMVAQYVLNGPHAISNIERLGGGWLLDLPKAQQLVIARRLSALPLAIQVETSEGPVGIVHADFPTDDWQHVETPFSEDDRQICLWSTMRFDRMYSVEVKNVRALIHGHLTFSTAQQIANVFFIDTGGWMASEGHFTFIDLAPLHLITGPGPDRLFEHKHNR